MTELQKQDQKVIASPLCPKVYFSRHRRCAICVCCGTCLKDRHAMLTSAPFRVSPGCPCSPDHTQAAYTVYEPRVNVSKGGVHTFGREG